MPIARWATALASAAWVRASRPAKFGLGVAFGVGGLLYAAFGPLWFDLAWWAFGRVFGPRLTVRRRTISSVAVAIVVTALIVATVPPPGQNPGTPNLAAATGTLARGSVSGTAAGAGAVATNAGSVATLGIPSAAPTAPDDDDEPGVVPPDASAPPIVVPGSSLPQVARLPGEPDPKLTPGVLNPAVRQATINSTICVSGWTATVRPSSSYTTRLKIQQIALYGYADTRTSSYEEDHLIPLELGGAPSDAKNLWPQPWNAWLADGRAAGARTKDAYESSLKRAVCAGTMTLAAAQSLIGIHWVHSYYGIALPNGPGSTGPAVPGSITPGSTAPAAPQPTATAGSPSASTACDPAYPTVCIPPPPPDLNCADVPYKKFTVLPPDPHHFDGDKDGIGCES